VLTLNGVLASNSELWRSTGVTNNQWATMAVSIGRRPNPFTLAFARVGQLNIVGE
jgi:hypothetical protein